MNARMLLVRGLDLPIWTLFLKGTARAVAEVRSAAGQMRARFFSTRNSVEKYGHAQPTPIFQRHVPLSAIAEFQRISEFNDHTLKHEFNLLGSGWTGVKLGMRAAGVEGYRYDAEISEFKPGPVWKLIDAPGYQPIDWQIDFKSGFRWESKQWWRKIPHGHLPGVDIKVPWELARMQHLPSLALEAIASRQDNPARAETLRREARSEILDFIDQNTPMFGVNWRCAMDVGIRAANWVFAIDLFRSGGFEFDQEFYAAYLASLEDHGDFITANFEKYPDFRANHYLANICGLAYIAAALPETVPAVLRKKKKWLTLSSNELLKEINYQFHEDGSCFEGSTSYHRLSAEMIVFTLAMLRGTSARAGRAFEVPKETLAKVQKFLDLTKALTKPTGHVTQIGDTDSGRFFKLPIRWVQTDGQLEEDDLDHRDLSDGVLALFGASTKSLTSTLVSGLVEIPFSPVAQPTAKTEIEMDLGFEDLVRQFNEAKSRRSYLFATVKPANDIEIKYFPDFGVAVLKSQNIFVSFRCGPLGQYGRAGHDHDDQLSVEIEIDGHMPVYDPGTYLYTPLKQRRNEYRSIRAHFAPQFEACENADLEAGLFYLRRVQPGKIIHLEGTSVAGMCKRGGGTVYRLITFEFEGIRIRDWSDGEAITDLQALPPISYSRGYGK